MDTPTLFKTTRKALGLKQDQMASVLGYDRKNTISDIENGRMEPNRGAMILLSIFRAHLTNQDPAD